MKITSINDYKDIHQEKGTVLVLGFKKITPSLGCCDMKEEIIRIPLKSQLRTFIKGKDCYFKLFVVSNLARLIKKDLMTTMKSIEIA